MLNRIEIGIKNNFDDAVGRRVAHNIHEALGFDVDKLRLVKVFTLESVNDFSTEAQRVVDEAILHDPILQSADLNKPLASNGENADFIVELSYRAGVTDNEAKTAKQTLALVFDLDSDFACYSSKEFHIWSKTLKLEDIQKIAKDLLGNELIERFRIKTKLEWHKNPGFQAQSSKVQGHATNEVKLIDLAKMTDQDLIEFSKANTLALSLEEMKIIQSFFNMPQIVQERSKFGLSAKITDAEIEMLAQTWSEHCKHKIFAANINYTDKEAKTNETINSLYKSYIQDSTATIRKNLGSKDYCKSVFKDNAGVIGFNNDYDVCIKVETHNSPSALDPYGGALTGIVGVNRDPMGTGMGAELICNTDVFCFASPFYDQELPPRLLHPRRILEGVRSGVEDGGNKSGVPTVNGSLVFDERFLGKPLVYCGTVGLMPRILNGQEGYKKQAQVGDIIVMVGGRIGKDGIHGATFSSEELHEGSPATAVQIGDPITQRKMYDFIIKARDLGLYSAITDNGAGGLSSSVGEMAEDTNGCLLDLAKAPLKYAGLRPWEMLLSEAQERMTLAVPPSKLEELIALAKHLDVEATALGEFTNSGYLHVLYDKTQVCYISMEFLHKGLPQMQLQATWQAPEIPNALAKLEDSQSSLAAEELLNSMLSRLNICSKESIIRQYDHEVKGGSVVKPLCGLKADGPSDAAVLRPALESEEGIVLSHGICPKFSDYDTYDMMANAMDEAIRNAVAVGADPDKLAGCDNFCWCDPVQSEKTPDGEYKLAQLVRACKALSDYAIAYSCPCISGKDSMKNDYMGAGKKISIPPTVLFSVLGYMPDVNKAITSDFKNDGDLVYLLGDTFNELGASELASQLNITCAAIPKVDAKIALQRYRSLYKAIQSNLITACHDLSDGGLAVALAEMALAGRLGAELNLTSELTALEYLYSESASRLLISVKPENEKELLQLLPDAHKLGKVTNEQKLNISFNSKNYLSSHIPELVKAFKVTLV